MINILLTCAGRRHYLASYFQDALSASGKVVGTDMDLSAPALQACDIAYKVPCVSSGSYLDVLREVMIKEKVDMLFSLNDLEVGLLAKNRERLEQETGATLYVPPAEALSICADKWSTYQFAKKIGVDTPATFLSLEEAAVAIELGEVGFPLIVKPRWGSASLGLFKANSFAELAVSYEACQRAVSTSALVALGADNAVIIQEAILGPEYGVDVLYDKNEVFIGFAAKKKISMRAGETDKAVTVSPEPFDSIIAKIAGGLPHRGNLDCDFLERDGKLYLLEFNPRFGGGYPFTHLAGANHVEMLIDNYQNKSIEPYRYQVGKTFAKFDSLVEVPAF